MNQFFTGASYLIDGFSLITKPGLKRFVFIPILINILVFLAFFIFLRQYFAELNHWVQSFLPSWLHWLATILWLLFFVSFFLLFIFTFVAVGNVISAPFNSFLSEKVELYLTGTLPESRGWFASLTDVPRVIGRQLQTISYYLPRALGLLILFFVPVVQVIAAPLWFIFNGWFMTLSYVDYPADNHRISFHDMLTKLKAKRGLALGFGVALLLAAMIPGINLFVIPAAVAGATKLWLNYQTVS